MPGRKSTSSDAPGLAPPPGITPYFEDPYSIQPYQTLTIIGLRYYDHNAGCTPHAYKASGPQMHDVGRLDAYLMVDSCVIGWVCFMVILAINWSITAHGGGIHQWNVTYEQVQYNYRFTNYGDIVYSLALLFTKLSILLLILRVFCSVRRNIPYYLTTLLIGINTTFYTIYFFIPIFFCKPRLKIWKADEPGHCLKINLLYLSSALACIASVIRIVYTVSLIRTKDYNYVRVQATMWAFAEIACGLLCGCLPILPALFRYYASMPPYDNPSYVSSKAAINHSLRRTNKPIGGRENVSREWIHLDERNVTSPFGGGGSHNGDEEALDDAVKGGEIRKGAV